MNHYFKCCCGWLFFLLSALAYSATGPLPAQTLFNVYYSPSPFKADNQYFLVYEIYLSNYMKSPATITAFNIQDENNKSLFGLNELSHAIQARTPENKNTLSFQPGETKTIFVWIPFAKENAVPTKLLHHLSIDSDFQNKKYNFELGTFAWQVNPVAPLIISSPLRGKNWLAGNAPSNTSDHRRTGLILNGKPYYAQRFAIDFVQMGADGKSYSGDVHKNTSYHCYNQDLLAVAEGTVVYLQDGLRENIPNSQKFAVTINEKNLPGNYLVLDLGNGKYAGYAHIIPGSFKVKVGDHVTQGQVLAKLGNSGNSSEPHLHFQIMNDKSFLASEGIPYGFTHFSAHPSELLSDPTGSMRIKVSPHAFQEYKNQLVLENALINFE